MSDEDMFQILSSYSVPNLRNRPLDTLIIKAFSTITKSLKHNNVHNLGI